MWRFYKLCGIHTTSFDHKKCIKNLWTFKFRKLSDIKSIPVAVSLARWKHFSDTCQLSLLSLIFQREMDNMDFMGSVKLSNNQQIKLSYVRFWSTLGVQMIKFKSPYNDIEKNFSYILVKRWLGQFIIKIQIYKYYQSFTSLMVRRKWWW